MLNNWYKMCVGLLSVFASVPCVWLRRSQEVNLCMARSFISARNTFQSVPACSGHPSCPINHHPHQPPTKYKILTANTLTTWGFWNPKGVMSLSSAWFPSQVSKSLWLGRGHPEAVCKQTLIAENIFISFWFFDCVLAIKVENKTKQTSASKSMCAAKWVEPCGGRSSRSSGVSCYYLLAPGGGYILTIQHTFLLLNS